MILVLALAAGLVVVAVLVRLLQQGASAPFSAVGQALKPLLVPVVELINEPAFVYCASALIVLSALAAILFYWLRVITPERERLRRAEVEVKLLSRPVAGQWQEELKMIGEALGREGVLQSAWAAFAHDAAEHRRLPLRRFADYANQDPSSPLNRGAGLMAALPSYYTSVGLILTFVGLVVALYFAARGFRSGDMAEARQSIIQLLNASAFKFLTSVAALISALLVSVAHRTAISRLRQQTYQLIALVDQRLETHRLAMAMEPGSQQDTLGRLDLILDELRGMRAALASMQTGVRERAVS